MTMPNVPTTAEVSDAVAKLRSTADMLTKAAERLESIPAALREGDLNGSIASYRADAKMFRDIAEHLS